MSQPENKPFKIPTGVLISLFLLLLVLLTAQTFSRYVMGGAGGSSARVATFEVTADLRQFQEVFPVQMKPGSEQKYSFQIENSSETALRILVEVHCNGNLPLQVTCQEAGTAQQDADPIIANALETATGSLEGTMESGSCVKNYTLVVSWPERENALTYAGGVGTVQLNVRAEQAD